MAHHTPVSESSHLHHIYELSSTEVANWVALALFLLAFCLYAFLRWYYHFKLDCTLNGKSNFYVAIYKVRLLFTYIGLFILALLIVLAGLLLMEQGTVVREEDSVEVEWARWATYAVVHPLLAFALATWYWQKCPVLHSFTFLSALYSLSFLFAILSTDYRRFVWYAIGWAFLLGWLFKLVFHFQRHVHLDGASFLAKLATTVTFVLYPVVLILEPSLCDVISQGAATWLYFALDLYTIVLLFFAGILYIPDSESYCCSKDKCECENKCSCHHMTPGTHVHHSCHGYSHPHKKQIGQQLLQQPSGYGPPKQSADEEWAL